MDKKLALLCCLFTILIVGSCVFFTNKTIDFPTILQALKIVTPAAIIAYFCGLYMGRTLLAAKVETNILNSEVQQQFVDDLLLTPDEVLNTNITTKTESADNETDESAIKSPNKEIQQES